jgi:hypothetical protein
MAQRIGDETPGRVTRISSSSVSMGAWPGVIVPTQKDGGEVIRLEGQRRSKLDLLEVVVKPLGPGDLHHLGREVDAREPAPAQKMQRLHLQPRAAACIEDRAGAEGDMPQHAGREHSRAGDSPWP